MFLELKSLEIPSDIIKVNGRMETMNTGDKGP